MQTTQCRARCSRAAVHNRLQGCHMQQVMLVRKQISVHGAGCNGCTRCLQQAGLMLQGLQLLC